MVSDLYDIIPSNGVYKIFSEKKKEKFSESESALIYRILNEVKYIMQSTLYDFDGRYLFSMGSKVRIETRIDGMDRFENHYVYYLNNFMSFTKYEDDYILITFAKDNLIDTYPGNLPTTDRAYDIRFGVICDDLEGVISFYRDQMTKDDFIKKIMMGEKL
jgi:hypothetical protein